MYLPSQNKERCIVLYCIVLKMRPHYSQSRRENATPSSATSPLASYKEVSPPRVCHLLFQNLPRTVMLCIFNALVQNGDVYTIRKLLSPLTCPEKVKCLSKEQKYMIIASNVTCFYKARRNPFAFEDYLWKLTIYSSVCPNVCLALQRRVCKIFEHAILLGLDRWYMYPLLFLRWKSKTVDFTDNNHKYLFPYWNIVEVSGT